MVMDASRASGGFRPKCPVCGNRAADLQASCLPFCSERCRLIDLGRWLDEQHAVPCERREEDEVEVEQVGDEVRPPIRLPPGWHDA